MHHIAKRSVQNFGLLLNRQNGTFGNHHVRARKYKLAHISGTVRRTKMELSPNCCARCGLSHESVVVYRALWPSATACRNDKILGECSALWGEPERVAGCISVS